MAAKYQVGQKVLITPVKNQHLSPRDSDIEAYAGRNGKVTDFYWMNTGRGEAFYIYTVRIEDIHQDIVLHEDEIQAYVE